MKIMLKCMLAFCCMFPDGRLFEGNQKEQTLSAQVEEGDSGQVGIVEKFKYALKNN
jgi:hypothetical protein